MGGVRGEAAVASRLIYGPVSCPRARYVTRWFLRLGTKRSGFRYGTRRGNRSRSGRSSASTRCAIPPAWRDVHVARHPATSASRRGDSTLAAENSTGITTAPSRRRELRKYHRARAREVRCRAFGEPSSRRLGASDSTRRGVGATVLRLISETFCRVGGERYARENGTFGITTLRKTHVELEDAPCPLTYTGKSNVHQRQFTHDPDIVRLVARLEAPGSPLFRYTDGILE